MVRMIAAAAQPHRPGAIEADRRVASRREQRMALVARRELRDMLGNRSADCFAELHDYGIDPLEQVAVGLSPAAKRLF